MKSAPQELDEFRQQIGAKALCGYVDWLESAAFELLVLDELGRSKRLDLLKRRVRKNYGGLANRLGFVMRTAQSH